MERISVSSYLELVRSILDNIDMMAWAVDKDGIIMLSEGEHLRTIGLDPDQLVGQNLFELYKDNQDICGKIRRGLAGERFVALTPVGDRTLENRYAPLHGDEGEVIGVVGVSIDVTEQLQAKQELESQSKYLKEQAELLDLAHDAIMVRRFDGTIDYWSRGAERMYGYSAAEALQQTSHKLLKATFPRERREIEKELIANGYWEGEITHVGRAGGSITVASRWVLKRDERGEPNAVLELNTDITARKEAEEAHARKQEELLRAQARAITDLSTPLIPITDEILVMPIIGVMDSDRASQVMESLLRGLSSSRGRYAIIDITGVPIVDTQVANALIRAAHAARLLGAQVVLTGIRPEVAQTLASLDTNLDGILTLGTLQSAIAFALGRRSLTG